ncbi:MAG: BolA family protein [Acidobacteriota bacterium]
MSDVYRRIERKVRAALAPTHLEITDESFMHSVPEGAESHFRLLVVADVFEGQAPVQRHQAVYRVLAEEMRDHIHALGLQTMTPEEWAADRSRNESPPCLGGGKVEA